MKKVRIDLSQTVPEPMDELKWGIEPPSNNQNDDHITLTHGEVRDDIPDKVVSDLVAIGYAVEIEVKKGKKSMKEEKGQPRGNDSHSDEEKNG